MEEITPAILFYCRGEGWTNSADLIRFQAPLSSTNFSSNTIFCYGAFPLKIERDSKQKKQESCRLLFRFFRLCMCSRMRDIVWFLLVRACTRVTNVHTIRHTFKQEGRLNDWQVGRWRRMTSRIVQLFLSCLIEEYRLVAVHVAHLTTRMVSQSCNKSLSFSMLAQARGCQRLASCLRVVLIFAFF